MGDRCLTFSLAQHWLAGEPATTLHARIETTASGSRVCIDTAPIDATVPISVAAARARRPLLHLDRPVRLGACSIDKPWGRELWFTGSERRGLSLVTDGTHDMPLAWWLGLAPTRIGARSSDVVLLKILAPHHASPLGDLYFEVHDEKREVYIVASVDARAWPDGIGAVRLGMNQTMRMQLGDAPFRAAYAREVAEYRRVRDDVDQLLDEQRAQRGIAADAVIEPAVMEGWLAEVPLPLRNREAWLRAGCDAYTHLHRVRVGDVVAIAPGQPHALQHGVSVVEFQTATYERRILAFAQKVLTQSHWDTDSTVPTMSLERVAPAPVQLLLETPDARVERVAAFPDFEVHRVRLAAGGRYLPGGERYRLCLMLSGGAVVADLDLAAGDACLVPRSATTEAIVNHSDDDAVVLLAVPAEGVVDVAEHQPRSSVARNKHQRHRRRRS